MKSECPTRNLFQVVVRATTGLHFRKVTRKLNDTDLRYRATNIRSIAFIGVSGAFFKSAVVGAYI